MTCIMQLQIDNQVSILDAVGPTMRSLEHIETWTDFFFHAAAKSTLPFKTPGYCQAQPRQSPFLFYGLRVYAELIEGGAV